MVIIVDELEATFADGAGGAVALALAMGEVPIKRVALQRTVCEAWAEADAVDMLVRPRRPAISSRERWSWFVDH